MINFQPVPGKLGHSDHGLWQARGADILLVRVMKLVDVGVVVVVVHRNSSYNSTNGDNH